VPINEDLLNPRRKNPLVLPLAVIALLAVVGGAFLLGRISAGGPAQEAGEAGAGGGGGAEGAVATAEEPPPPAPAEVAMGEVLPGTDGIRRLVVDIEGSLTSSINAVIGAEAGDPLALVASRLLVWGLSPSRDLRSGDRLEILYSLRANEEPLVHALRFRSGKLGRELRAYRYHVPGAPFARYYDENGREIEERLRNGPIDHYEQITSLLKDGRGHKGVDFKAPVGTEVRAPWDATVIRKNWNYRYNGGSLELRDGKGRSIVFLHLDSVEKSLQPGSRVRRGQVVAKSGNTGRSTAPHLHYQVMAGKKVLDPFDLHETWRESLPVTEQAAFAEVVASFDGLLAGGGLVAEEVPTEAVAP